MKKLIIIAVSALTMATAHTAAAQTTTTPPAPATPAPTPAEVTDLTVYSGTYSLQGPNGTVDVRIWMDEEGKLNAELIGRDRQTVLRPSDTPHKFLHETIDQVWFLFTMENGRATALTMHQGPREITGPRTK